MEEGHFQNGNFAVALSLKEKAVRLRLTGHTLKEVSEMTGASQTSVKRWVEAYVAKKGLQGSVFGPRAQEEGGINQ